MYYLFIGLVTILLTVLLVPIVRKSKGLPQLHIQELIITSGLSTGGIISLSTTLFKIFNDPQLFDLLLNKLGWDGIFPLIIGILLGLYRAGEEILKLFYEPPKSKSNDPNS